MKPATRTLLAVIAALAFAATASAAKLANIKPILIPAGLDARDARAAMIQTLAQKDISPPQQGGPSNAWEGIVDELLRARAWGYQSQFRDTPSRNLRPWFIEAVENDAVVFGCKVRRHYMSVRMAVSDDKITPQVVTSENLDQTKTRIHDNAVVWITNLSTEIRKTLGQFSALKAQLAESVAPTKEKAGDSTNPAT